MSDINRRIFIALLLLAAVVGVSGEETVEELGGIIGGSVAAFLILVVGLIILLYLCYRRSESSPAHVTKKHHKPALNGLPPPRIVYSVPRRKKPQQYRVPHNYYHPREPVAPKGTELTVYNPRVLQHHAVRPIPYSAMHYPVTLSTYYLRPHVRQPVTQVRAASSARHAPAYVPSQRKPLHVSSKDVYTDTDANKLHIQEVESVEGQIHLSDEEHEGHKEVYQPRHRSRSNSHSSSTSSRGNHSDTFVPTVRPAPGDITFSQPSEERRPSTGESPQPPDYIYSQVIKSQPSGNKMNLRQTWQPEGQTSSQSPLTKTWHPNNVDLRETMSEKIEEIVESGKKSRPDDLNAGEETHDYTVYPPRATFKEKEEKRHFLAATQPASAYSKDADPYSRFISKSSRFPTDQSSSGYGNLQTTSLLTRNTIQVSDGAGPSKIAVDPTSGEQYPYSMAVHRMAKSQKDSPAPFSYIPVEEIGRFRQRAPSGGSKSDAESVSAPYSKSIPQESMDNYFGRSQRNNDNSNETKPYSIPTPPPFPF